MSSLQEIQTNLKLALTWCLAWGDEGEPKCDRSHLDTFIQSNGDEIPADLQDIVQQVEQLQAIPSDAEPETLSAVQQLVGDIWNQTTPIGLVYGGATKIKNYVFDSANLMEIRGASAILDRINLIDIPAFFGKQNPNNDLEDYRSPRNWLKTQDPQLADALIPQLIIYSTGGNVLAFCPAAYTNRLADAIEKRYTQETLTANSCAVGETFRLLEIRFGLFQENLDATPWFDWYQDNASNPLVEAYFGKASLDNPDQQRENFFNSKSFNELTRKLAIRFNQRRSGNDTPSRDTTRRYPPHFETHPYLMRDDNNRISTLDTIGELPSEPKFSEPLARKYLMGQQTKVERNNRPGWYQNLGLDWNPGYVDSWVERFRQYLTDESHQGLQQQYYRDCPKSSVTETRNVEEIANASNGFLSFIYADGNNMGGYIQKIKTPEAYSQFSEHIFEATEKSVYYALANRLHPHQLKNLKKQDNQHRNGDWVHPFEIIAIGGDDVMIIVPANQALQIAQDIGEKFEEILEQTGGYRIPDRFKPSANPHRDRRQLTSFRNSQLSTSIGVLTTKYDTPIYYANRLVNQLLKSAKKYAKTLKKEKGYLGGTIDILTLKSVTMISSNIEEFRQQAWIVPGPPTLKLHASPYTLQEVGSLIQTIQAFKESEFPRSQLYQIRSLLERGKQTAILNYRYFRVRLKPKQQNLLKDHFEQIWCTPKDPKNNGNLAPWMSQLDDKNDSTIYETLWRDIVDLYPFIEGDTQLERNSLATPSEVSRHD